MKNERSFAERVVVVAALLLVFGLSLLIGLQSDLRKQEEAFSARTHQTFNLIKSTADATVGVLATLRSTPSMPMQSHLDHATSFSVSLFEEFPYVSGAGRFAVLEKDQLQSFRDDMQKFTGTKRIWRYALQPGGNVVDVASADAGMQFPIIYAAGRSTEGLINGSASPSLTHTVESSTENTASKNDRLMVFIGFDLMSSEGLAKSLRTSLFGDVPAAVPTPEVWPGDGQLLVFRSGEKPEQKHGGAKNLQAGYWLELDFRALCERLATEQGWTSRLELITASFESSDTEPQMLLQTVPEVSPRDSLTGLLRKKFSWTETFTLAGNSVHVNFEQPAVIALATKLKATGVALLLTLVGWFGYWLYRRHLSVINEQKKQRAALHFEQQRAAVTLASIGDAVVTLDINGRVVYLNRAAEVMLQISQARVCGQSADKLLQFVDRRSNSSESETAHHRGVDLHNPDSDLSGTERCLRGAGGGLLLVNKTNSPLYDQSNVHVGNVIVLRDITAEVKLKESLEFKANHDALTGIANRLRFNEIFNELFNLKSTTNRGYTLCYADLDEFKQVNDTSGHAAGDELLVQLAIGLLGVVREQDLVARLGGDEFAILICDCYPHAAVAVVERIHQHFQKFDFAYGDQLYPVRASIGYVHFDPRKTNQKDVLAAADAACYEAKRAGRNRIAAGSVDIAGADQDMKVRSLQLDNKAANDGRSG